MANDLGYVLEIDSQSRGVPTASAYEPAAASAAGASIKRYKDAYRVGGFIVGAGEFFKTVGIVLAVLIGVGALIVAGKTQDGQQQTAILLSGSVVAGFAGGMLFLFGILVAAQGQLLKATLDTAVNTSPFLTNDDRARMMSLPGASATEGIAQATSFQTAVNQASTGIQAPGVPSSSTPSSTQSICRSCGSKLGANVKFCGGCGMRI